MIPAGTVCSDRALARTVCPSGADRISRSTDGQMDSAEPEPEPDE